MTPTARITLVGGLLALTLVACTQDAHGVDDGPDRGVARPDAAQDIGADRGDLAVRDRGDRDPVDRRVDQADPFEVKRRAAVNRRRRLILNNDGDDVLYAKTPTPGGLLAARTTGLETTHVDAPFCCTNRGTFSLHSHRTKVATQYSKGIMPALVAAGTDPLQVMIDGIRGPAYRSLLREALGLGGGVQRLFLLVSRSSG